MLLSYYGDDFTGSTDVMEALETHGVKTVLFTRQPSGAEYRQYTDYQAVGLAGTSRSQTPEWMETHLREAFRWLKGLGAELCHYKVCSTFDSSPAIGSIGRAIEIGCDVFGQDTLPLVVGAPQLKRYTAFGNLFAAYQGQVYRIDRHPVMSRHPVTPMDEADLRLHLGKQTARPVTLATADGVGQGVILFDVMDEASQRAAGRQVLSVAKRAGPFVAGSSGIEYAVLPHWVAEGRASGSASFAPLNKVDRIAVVSGSCSPTTERQIRHALSQGFTGIAIDPLDVIGAEGAGHLAEVIAKGVAALQAGKSVIVYSALGGGTDRSAALDSEPGNRHRIGVALGQIARALIERCGLTRAILAGGDTSSHALGELDILALTTRFPLKATPGSPLCVAHGGKAIDGLEIAMKGGQVGNDDYFTALRDGA